jgi:hypothetical protein
MNSKLKRKMELTFIGYLFVILNVVTTAHNFSIVGIFFGLVACSFFIRALMIRE